MFVRDDGGDPGWAQAQRAAALRALADRIETVMDPPLDAARTPDWDCPNADDVRGQLGVYQSAARSAAADLREEALSADAEARRVRQDAQDAADAAAAKARAS